MNYSKKNNLLVLIISFACLTTSCNEDKGDIINDIEPLDIKQYQAQISNVSDEKNNGNPSDIRVSFIAPSKKDSITQYRITIAKSDQILDEEQALNLDANSVSVVQGGQDSYQLFLSESQLDLEGKTLVDGEEYVVFLVSTGTYRDSLVYGISGPSSPIKYAINSETSTLVSSLGANDCISLDRDGNIYVSEYGNYNGNTFTGTGESVIKVTPSGELSTFASGLIGPVGSVFDESGNFYVVSGSNFTSGTIVKISPTGEKEELATIDGYPSGIVIGEDGNFYVANYWLGNISKVTPSGEVSIFVEDSALKGCIGIVNDNDGNLITGNGDTGELFSINTSGIVTKITTVGPASYITYFEGNIYSTSVPQDLIYKTTLDGQTEVFAGTGIAESIDGELSRASFNGPNGISVDTVRRLLYVSEGDRKLRVIPLD